MKSTLMPLVALAVGVVLASPALAGTQAAAPATLSKAQPATHAVMPAADLVDLNTATETQLAALPGVGDVYAKKIVEGRPYKSRDELVRRKIVPESAYKKFHGKVVARHSETK
jgi:competence protein ComEA